MVLLGVSSIFRASALGIVTGVLAMVGFNFGFQSSFKS